MLIPPRSFAVPISINDEIGSTAVEESR